MLKKLGKSITIVNLIAFIIVTLIGGVSIFLTKDILHNAYRIKEISKDITEIDRVHSEAYRLHLSRINTLIEKSSTNMRLILFMYLAFIAIGGLCIYAGHILLLNKVVRPIKTLASATMEFAEGTLDKRVFTDSKTEIGQLYQSFNQMAEKLQGNDEVLRKFNEELERKVRERTVELQNSNEQLQKTQRALIRTEKIAAVGQIATGVTHEIKNPLNSLSINTQMLTRELADKFGPGSSAHESAILIKSEINRINNILEEFVKFAKFPEPRLIENDINQVVKEVADLISESAKDSGVALDVCLRENMPVMIFDNWQLREVLINLTQNAIRAMKEGGRLELKTALVDDAVIIQVKDTGEGIPENNLSRIFTPFYSTREGGLGLGLSIVQRIVESHGGRINCLSKMGKGTVFEVFLPLERG